MPSLRRERPLMVNKGTQCTFLSYTQNILESEYPNTSASFKFEERQQSSYRDTYHTNIIGDVNSISLGPTVIYKLDPDATKEILLGNPGFIDKLDVCGCISTPACNSFGSCKHESLNDERANCISDDKVTSSKVKDVMEEEQPQSTTSGHLYIASPQSCTKVKKPKCHAQTLIIYPRWWSCRQLFNQTSCEKMPSSNNK